MIKVIAALWSVALSLSLQAEARHLAGQASSVERECSRLERDLEEGSRRLAMAHNEMRRLTDELESAHLTQRAYGEIQYTVLISYLQADCVILKEICK